MSLRKPEFQRLSIDKKDSGQVEWVSGLFFILILAIVMYTELQLAAWSSTAVYLEDALAASNLASALIDVEEYGKSHKILIDNEKEAFLVYKEAVRANLGLDEQWKCRNENLISGPVEIVKYIIYNVDGQQVEAMCMGHDGEVLERKNGVLGTMAAPDGTPVEHTGIYSELRFEVKGFPGMVVEAHKGKLVDIVAETMESKGEEDEIG